LFMYRELFDGSYLQEEDSNTIYVVRQDTLIDSGNSLPHMAPVLLVPKGFLAGLKADVINEELIVVGKIEPTGVDVNEPSVEAATNLLTPNEDGINDFWQVEDIDRYPNNHVRIIDKRGRTVYEKQGYQNEWQGRQRGGNSHGELLPEGTYFYQVDYGDPAKKPLKGYITILHDVQRRR